MLRLKGQTESGEWVEFDIDDLNAVHARYENDDSKFGLWVNKRKPNSLNGWMAIFVVSATIQPADDPRKAGKDEMLRESLELGIASLTGMMNYYGTGLQVAIWHLNGDTEPFDSFIDEEGCGNALDALSAALDQTKPKDGE